MYFLFSVYAMHALYFALYEIILLYLNIANECIYDKFIDNSSINYRWKLKIFITYMLFILNIYNYVSIYGHRPLVSDD